MRQYLEIIVSLRIGHLLAMNRSDQIMMRVVEKDPDKLEDCSLCCYNAESNVKDVADQKVQ